MEDGSSTAMEEPRSSSRHLVGAQPEKTGLVVVGACYLDTILSVPFFPAEDEKLRASSLVRRRGGNGPNTLEVLQQLIKGHAVEEIRQSLGPHVDLSCCIYRSEHTEAASSYIIRSLQTGSRTIVNYNKLPEMSVEEFQASAAKVEGEAYWFHFEGRIPETLLLCIQSLKVSHPKAKISVEVEKPGRRGLLKLAHEADVVFYSKDWAQYIAYRSAQECLEEKSKQLTKPFLQCCTWGREGASIFDRRAGKIVHAPAFLPGGKEAVDTTGAGDTFIAAILYCLILNPDLDSQLMVEFANKLAGHKVAREGFDGLGQVALSDLPAATSTLRPDTSHFIFVKRGGRLGMVDDIPELTPKFTVSCQVLFQRRSGPGRRLMRPLAIAIMLVFITICSVLLIFLHAIYRPPDVLIQYLQHRWPDVLFHVSTKQRLVALTIDDAPSEHTRSLLEILQANGAAATFFIIGSQVPGREGILQEMIAAGSELGNHTMHDEPSRSLSDAELRSQIQDVDVMIKQAYTTCHKEAPRYFRPGSGFFSTHMRSTVQSMGLKMVLGNVYPHDPQIHFWRINAWHILSVVQPGGIVICHDGRSWTAPMLKKVLPEMRRRGYHVVTLTELLKAENY